MAHTLQIVKNISIGSQVSLEDEEKNSGVLWIFFFPKKASKIYYPENEYEMKMYHTPEQWVLA